MRLALAAVWAVILAGGITQTANGLQTDVLGVRASIEAFPAWMLGIIMASYYVGYSAGPLASRGVIARFGHVSSIIVALLLAAIVIVLHGLLVAPVPWALLRVIDGLALSIAYVALESWINDRVENRVRGRIFSLYMVAQMAGMTVAQILFSMGNPKTLSLFALSAAIFAAGAIPVFAVRGKAPAMAPPVPFRLPQLFRVSPLGALTTILAGVSWSIVFTFGPVYAQKSGFSLSGVSLFMGLAMVGGAVMQFPLGWISDLIGRRATIGWMSGCGIAASLFGLWTDGWPAIYPFTAALLTGGFIFPLYGLAVAYTNDRVAPGARVAAAAGLVLLFGLGSIFGPLLTGWAISAMGAGGYFAVLAAVMGLSVTATAFRR
jgi:MFS family permease